RDPDRGNSGRDCQQPRRAAALPGRGIPAVGYAPPRCCNAVTIAPVPKILHASRRVQGLWTGLSKNRTKFWTYLAPMALTQRLEFRQSQSLVMTPQLMQAIKLLQLSNLDLSAFVEEELERNPLLERGNDGPEPQVAGEAVEPPPFSDAGEAGSHGEGG